MRVFVPKKKDTTNFFEGAGVILMYQLFIYETRETFFRYIFEFSTPVPFGTGG